MSLAIEGGARQQLGLSLPPAQVVEGIEGIPRRGDLEGDAAEDQGVAVRPLPAIQRPLTAVPSSPQKRVAVATSYIANRKRAKAPNGTSREIAPLFLLTARSKSPLTTPYQTIYPASVSWSLALTNLTPQASATAPLS